MRRFMGIMPAEEISIMRRFTDSANLNVTIKAGSKGWTIIWADYSTNYSDADDTAENNFAKAYDTAVGIVGPLRKISEG